MGRELVGFPPEALRGLGRCEAEGGGCLGGKGVEAALKGGAFGLGVGRRTREVG